MRIIGGSLKGRQLKAPKGNRTRPTTDRVRESLFSSLTSLAGADLGGGAVLDAFAGSGALGFEALSRGAGPVTFIDDSRDAIEVLKLNATSIGVREMTRIIRGNAFSLASGGAMGGPFSLLLLDPPYTLDPNAVTKMVEALVRNGHVADECVLSWEHGSGLEVSLPSEFRIVRSKRYGTTELEFAVFERGTGEK